MSDIPSGTGLGSSGSFTVGLINALAIYTKQPIIDIADKAFFVERQLLKRSIGKQDQYSAMCGGIKAYRADKDGRVTYRDLNVQGLDEYLSLFYTRIRRKSEPILFEVQTRTESLDEIKNIGLESWDALNEHNFIRFGELLDRHWEVKRKMSDKISNPQIDAWYKKSKQVGALGGKICFIPNTSIKTKNGFKPIEKIIVGEKVYDHQHNLQKVLKKSQRWYCGNILEIKVKGINLPIYVTPEHPIFTTIKHPMNKRTINRKIINLLILKEANEYQKGDLFLVPINEEVINQEKLKILRLLEQPKYSNCDIYKNIPNEVPIDFHLLNILGWYIAEGSANRKQFNFVLNIKEKNHAEQLIKSFNLLFSRKLTMKIKGNSISMVGSSVVVSNLLQDLCGIGASNKRIPQFVMSLPHEKQAILLRALWLGDGTINSKYDHRTKNSYLVCSYKTVSERLAKQLQELCFRLGFICSLNTEQMKSLFILRNKKITHPKKIYIISIHGEDAIAFKDFINQNKLVKVKRSNVKSLSQRKEIIQINEHKYAKRSIVEIKETAYEGYVYNLNVEKTHTFIANDIAVHNCGAGGGGFFMFCTPDEQVKKCLKKTMEGLGLIYMPFKFHPEGSKVIEI